MREHWSFCKEEGHVHWGSQGAAGILFRYVPPKGEPTFLLQQRSQWVDNGLTWDIPGGAIRGEESPEATVRREVEEELGVLPAYRLTGIEVQDCGGGWKFHLLTADVESPFVTYCVRETEATGWFTGKEMQHLVLHPGLKKWLEKTEQRKT